MKLKPRNHVVLAMLKSHKSSGTHGKSKKAQRRQDKVDLHKQKQE
jgi:hypothetical protein